MAQARSIIRWLWLPVLLAFLYSGWVLYSRQAGDQATRQDAEQKKATADLQVIEKLGGSELKILMLYANPPVIKKGERGLLCYGVSNAQTVSIEPAVEGTGPSLSRCVEVKPVKDTEYALVAKDAKGSEVKQTILVRVQ